MNRRERVAESEGGRPDRRTNAKPKEPAPPAATSQSASAEDHQARRALSRDREKKKKRAERLEGEIAQGEKELFALREDLRQAPGDDWEKLHVLSQKEQELKKRIDGLMTEWERLSVEARCARAKAETDDPVRGAISAIERQRLLALVAVISSGCRRRAAPQDPGADSAKRGFLARPATLCDRYLPLVDDRGNFTSSSIRRTCPCGPKCSARRHVRPIGRNGRFGLRREPPAKQ